MKTLKHLALAALVIAGLLLPWAMTPSQRASACSYDAEAIGVFLSGGITLITGPNCDPTKPPPAAAPNSEPCALNAVDASGSTPDLHKYSYDIIGCPSTHVKGEYNVGQQTAHEELNRGVFDWVCPSGDPWSYDWSAGPPAPCNLVYGTGQGVPLSTLNIDNKAHDSLAAALNDALTQFAITAIKQAAAAEAAKEAAKQAAIHAALFTTTTTVAGTGAAASVFGSTPANEVTSITATGSGSTAAVILGSTPANEATSITATGSGSTAASVFPGWPLLSTPSSQGEAVRSLQYLLQQCGATTLSTDAKFGPETDAAVRAFQKAQGLTADGQVGAATWLALIVPPMPPGVPMQLGMPMQQQCMPMQQGMAMQPMQQGSTGPAVQAVQSQLKSRGVALTVDGVFGKTTDAAVKAYQKGQRITANGQVGADTWQLLLAGS